MDSNIEHKTPASSIEKSRNTKLIDCSTTYAGLNSCPNCCPFKKTNSCYGKTGPINMMFIKHTMSDLCPREVARFEAKEIKKLSGKRNLRIHSIGDCRTNLSAQIVSKHGGL